MFHVNFVKKRNFGQRNVTNVTFSLLQKCGEVVEVKMQNINYTKLYRILTSL